MQPESTPGQPIVKMSPQDMVKKAKRDAASAEQHAVEAQKSWIRSRADLGGCLRIGFADVRLAQGSGLADQPV